MQLPSCSPVLGSRPAPWLDVHLLWSLASAAPSLISVAQQIPATLKSTKGKYDLPLPSVRSCDILVCAVRQRVNESSSEMAQL